MKQINRQNSNILRIVITLELHQLIWDSNEVMIAYIDEPVMTFTDYLVFCGGPMGLWFVVSHKCFYKCNRC